MIDTETARTKNVRAVLAKRQIFFARLQKRGADRYLFRRCKYDELNERVEESVYDEIIDYAWTLGIRKAYIQEEGTVSESFIPKFDYKKTIKNTEND